MAENTASKPRFDNTTLWSVFIALILSFVAGYYIRFPGVPLLATVKVLSIDGVMPTQVDLQIELPESDGTARLDFGDNTPSASLHKGIQQVTHNYSHPGVYQVSVRSAVAVLSEPTKVYCETKGWELFASDNNCYNEIKKLPYDLALDTGIMSITNPFLMRNGVDTNTLKLRTLCNYQPINNTSNDFTFTSAFLPETNCNCITWCITGDKNTIYFVLGEPLAGNGFNCSNGSNTSRSIRAITPGIWQNFSIDVVGNEVTASLDSLPVISLPIGTKIGNILGVEVKFNGSLHLNDIKIKTPDGLSPMFETFD